MRVVARRASTVISYYNLIGGQPCNHTECFNTLAVEYPSFIEIFVKKSLFSVYFPGWLEDIGLPQYKDSFSEGSVDGRMLNYLTFVSKEDL